ncbi:helix-turn-helix transcriptional regulator [Paenibacillus albicereus]|uniref:Helix-turn-helix transcriptional regulator n=1 Tax=Paenibacillus albicereus TaxID=2726185 RepID=A0A6H2H144_9BACL|nr:helix-turn-helix transcriptional regulator [Paenibacillus albicereus]QJC53404.1 helix-turn-helix transcriptional regulator [Paenibacillus albicereus]
MTTSDIPGRDGLGGRLRAQRKRLGWTQQRLADELSIAKSTVSQYENSVNAPDYDMLLRLCGLFEVSADYLLGVPASPAGGLGISGKAAAGSPSPPAPAARSRQPDEAALADEPLMLAGLTADERQFLLASLDAYRAALGRRGF